MVITVIASFVYMWLARIPHPFGTRPVLGLLMTRAVGGLLSVYGLYYSVQYISLSEATVLSFLSPIIGCYALSILDPQEVFSRRQQIAGAVSLIGVIMIARPFSPSDKEEATPESDNHHFMAIVVSLVGVFGGAASLVAIRKLGPRAHVMVSVNYFSLLALLVSSLVMAFVPSVPFRLPGNLIEWGLVFGLGTCGFVLQFFMTAGLAYVPPPSAAASTEKGRPASQGSRATFMIYTQMLFALFFDKVIWGSTLTLLSWVGSCLILGSAISVALGRDGASPSPGEAREGYNDEEYCMETV